MFTRTQAAYRAHPLGQKEQEPAPEQQQTLQPAVDKPVFDWALEDDVDEQEEQVQVLAPALEEELPPPLRPDQVVAINSLHTWRNEQAAQ